MYDEEETTGKEPVEVRVQGKWNTRVRGKWDVMDKRPRIATFRALNYVCMYIFLSTGLWTGEGINRMAGLGSALLEICTVCTECIVCI